MARYSVTAPSGQTSVTVTDFLSSPTLSPLIENSTARIPELARCSGIVHYTRSGIRTVITDAGFQMQTGDFLVVADSVSTGGAQCVTLELTRQDHVYVTVEDTEDPFAENACAYFYIKENAHLISWRVEQLERIINSICTSGDINNPIRDIYIVTHANESGIMMRSSPSDTDFYLDYDELWDYIERRDRPQITSRIIQDNANVHIRGCRIGREQRYLNKIRELFGNQVRVTAPKHIDSFGFREDHTTESEEITESTTHRYEYMLYCFSVFSRDRINNKSSLVRAFDEKLFTDIYGTRITTAQLNSWIPADITRNATSTFQCTIQIPHVSVAREFRHRLREVFHVNYSFSSGSSVPESEEAQLQELRRFASEQDTMQSDYEFPEYERWGYSNFDEFWNGLDWSSPDWNEDERNLHTVGTRHEYELRIPITGPDSRSNQLKINAMLDEGGPSGTQTFIVQDILDNDTLLFGNVP